MIKSIPPMLIVLKIANLLIMDGSSIILITICVCIVCIALEALKQKMRKKTVQKFVDEIEKSSDDDEERQYSLLLAFLTKIYLEH